MSKSTVPGPIQSTAGAIPIRNDKGQVAMQKVKVHRYVSGKRPDYAPRSSSEDESEEEEFVGPTSSTKVKVEEEEEFFPDVSHRHAEFTESEKKDPRLRRLMETSSSASRARRVTAPEIVGSGSEDEEYGEGRPGRHYDSDSESGDEQLDDTEFERKRAFLRQKALEKQEEEELLAKEEEKDSDESEESESEYEEYTDSEEEARPRLKPVFVRKTERITLKDKEDSEEVQKRADDEIKKKAEERREDTLKLVESLIRKDKKGSDDVEKEANLPQINDVNTDDENEEVEYEAWKLRELKRIKRDRDEREAYEREKMEIERLHNLTEEERRMEMKLKPKQVINKAEKGKYKFLQKYYHRGVFYLDKEDTVLKRDYSEPTLEDHFDKTILPKVMQVKNFGRSGRTKYTHLVDQDTTNFDSPWQAESAPNLKFHATQAAGVRHVFDRPATKKRKTDVKRFGI